jgi:hypothetical protein
MNNNDSFRQKERKHREADKEKKKARKKAAKADKKTNAHIKTTLDSVPCTDGIDSEWECENFEGHSGCSSDETRQETTKQTLKTEDHSSLQAESTKPHSPSQKPSPDLHFVNLSYMFSPRVHPSTFYLYAYYTFTSQKHAKASLLSLLSALDFRFCPHITSRTNSTGGNMLPDSSFLQTYVGASETRPIGMSAGSENSSKPKAEEVKTYKQSCDFCTTEYQVSVKISTAGLPRVTEVCFAFQYCLGSASIDGRWDAFLLKKEGADRSVRGEAVID